MSKLTSEPAVEGPKSVPPLARRQLAPGREMRGLVPRFSHAAWSAPASRPDVVTFIRNADRGRAAALLPLKYARMCASPFGFLRGAAALMAHDLSTTPSTGWRVQACGDAHLANFGAFATPERELVFDANDFDETTRGPWEWDLKRLGTSVVLVGRQNRLSAAACTDAALALTRSYCLAMHGYAAAGYLAVAYAQLDSARVLTAISEVQRKRARQEFEKATRNDQLGALSKLTELVDGTPRIADRAPLLTHIETGDLLSTVENFFEGYKQSLRLDVRDLFERYTLVDVARKIVGVGSVGTGCFIALLTGRNAADPLFLQVKEAGSSVLEAYVGAAAFAHHGERVVDGQRRIQAASDIFLGWAEIDGTHYYVRQLQDMKGAPDLSRVGARSLQTYAGLCGWALARAHARSGDPVCIAGYLGRGDAMDRAITAFSNAYADQTERDHAVFVAGTKDDTRDWPTHC